MIQTGTDKKKRKLLPHEVKKVIVSDFYMAVRDSFENPDIKLVPMVSIVSRKKERHKEEDFRYFALWRHGTHFLEMKPVFGYILVEC